MKLKITALVLAIVCFLTSCSSAVSNTTKDLETAKTTIQLITKNDYLDALYGYYECGDYYYFIAEDTFEKKNKTDGKLENSGMLAGITVYMENDGVSFDIIFYRDAYPRVIMFCNSEGVISDDNKNEYREITKEAYDSVESIEEEEKELEDYIPDTNQQVDNTPWYLQTFDFSVMMYDLQTIDNLLAVGKEHEALEAIQTKILGKLDAKVSELIQKREYWAAYNYVAMYDGYISDSNINSSFKFLEKYMEETNPPSAAISLMGGVNFYTYLHGYYWVILQARKTDTNRMEKKDCLYLVNEYFLQNGWNTVSSLWDDEYNIMYFTDFLDQNFNVTDYFIVCPYTGQLRHLPAGFYFADYAHFNEPALKDVL